MDYPWITVSISTQQLTLHLSAVQRRHYQVSTAKNGAGERENSGCTPRGWHHIAQKIGELAPINSVFVARQMTGEIYTDTLAKAYPQRDWILSRILWLGGDEPQINQGEGCDTYQRYIYIHGTPDTEPMGIPMSHGCIRMRNTEVMALFEHVHEGTKVVIFD